MSLTDLDKAPFPWFGGKSRAADTVWSLLGDVPHYVEPFFGSGAVLLNRPHACNRPYVSETVNDLDGHVANFWRAIAFDPEATAHAASWPVTEVDKHARQIRLQRWVNGEARDRLAWDATWYDPVMAGWWAWALSVQIGAIGGPWTADPVTGRITKAGGREPGVSRDLPAISSNGQGVNRPGGREPGVLDPDGRRSTTGAPPATTLPCPRSSDGSGIWPPASVTSACSTGTGRDSSRPAQHSRCLSGQVPDRAACSSTRPTPTRHRGPTGCTRVIR